MRTKLVLIALTLAGLTYLTVSWIHSLPKTDAVNVSADVSVEFGEELFWGKGRCHVCHRVGDRGYALRGPNLGASQDGPLIAERAQARAEQLGKPNGTTYLVESILEPGAFVVPKFTDEMPLANEAPIALSPPEVESIVLYLQSLGGNPNADEIRVAMGLGQPVVPRTPNAGIRVTGNVEAGRDLFFDSAGPAACSACHVAGSASGRPEGNPIGPDLVQIASIRNAEDILKKVTEPNVRPVSGYEEEQIRLKDGRIHVGRVTDESDKVVALAVKGGDHLVFAKRHIESRVVESVSQMPGNYAQLLTGNQIQDLLAYLLTQNQIPRTK